MALPIILKEALEQNASDVILTSKSKPVLKINGDVNVMDNHNILTPVELKKELFWIMSEKQKTTFEQEKELDFSIELKGHSRFRVNIFYSNTWIWAVMRPIKSELPSFRELWLPKKMLDLIKRKNWIILVTGSVWSWKSTTLSALVDTISANMKKHIITIEDPIEYTFDNNKSIVEQREVGTNTNSFENWLKYSLRQASDVIMVWEMRDLETFRLALRAAETWNLVLTTLHTAWAARTVARIVDMFPWDEKDQIKSQLSDSLIWVIWQDLLKTKDWKGRTLATELLVNNTSISNMIRKGVLHQIDSAIETWAADWMYTMKSCLDKLKNEWKI